MVSEILASADKVLQSLLHSMLNSFLISLVLGLDIEVCVLIAKDTLSLNQQEASFPKG